MKVPRDRNESTQVVCSFDFLSLCKVVCVIWMTDMHQKMSSYCKLFDREIDRREKAENGNEARVFHTDVTSP